MSSSQRILILDRQAIDRKLQRMAYEIWERNSHETSITMVGVESGGLTIANELAARLRVISPLEIIIEKLRLNKKEPHLLAPEFSAKLNKGPVVLVDDVASSGRTLLYALQPILAAAPSRISVAVLVDRKHKSFPVSADIVGHTLATTLQENITVAIEDDKAVAAYIQ